MGPLSRDRPRRRPDLEEIRGPSGELVGFRDPVVDRRVELGPVSRALMQRLDGERTVAEIVESVAAELAAAPALVETRFRSLLLLNLLEGSGEKILERARIAGQSPLEVVLLPGTRFQCQGSGECCRAYHLGPMTDEDRARLGSLDLAGAGFGPGPYFDERQTPDPAGTFLKVRSDGSCVFLREDRRCGIHAAFGASAKPGFCQAYPFRLFPTIHGIKAIDAGECSSFATSVRAGPTLEGERARLRTFAPAKPRIDHPVVQLGLETPCDLGYVLEIQEAVAARLSTTAPVGEALLDGVRFVLGAISALASCPLDPGEPEPALERALARLAAEPRAPVGPASRAAFSALSRLPEELLAACPLRASDPRESAFAEVLALARVFAVHAADPTVALAPDELAIARTVASGPDVDEPLALSLRQAFWGDQLLVELRVLPGLVRIATSFFVAVIAAKRQAWKAGSPRVRAVDLSAAHSLVARMLRRRAALPVFARHDAAARPVAEAAAAWISTSWSAS